MRRIEKGYVNMSIPARFYGVKFALRKKKTCFDLINKLSQFYDLRNEFESVYVFIEIAAINVNTIPEIVHSS